MKPTQALKRAAYRLGLDVRRALPLPKSGAVPSFTDAFHEQVRLLGRMARPVIFDAGAHIGQTAVKYKTLFPDAAVYSFEPFEGSFAQLVTAVRGLNDVHPINSALGRYAGELTLNVNRSTATNSLLRTDTRASETWNGADVTDTIGENKVPVETIDSFLATHPAISTIDILKIDAQGSEMDILLGARGALQARRVRLVYLEIIVLPTYIGQQTLEAYLAFLRGSGFALHNVFNFCYTSDGQLSQLDALFRSDSST